MSMVLVRNWWALALRGLIAIVFGLLAIFSPGTTLAALVLLFGAYALVDGIFAIIAGVRATERHERWWPFALEGIVDFIAAAISFFMPLATALALLYLVSALAVITGVLRIIAAVRLRKQIHGEWLLILNGILSVVFGVLLVLWPAIGLLTLVWLIGVWALVIGAFLVGLGFRLRGRTIPPPGTPRPAPAR